MGFAKNAIDAKKSISMDIIKSMKGLTVEIQNNNYCLTFTYVKNEYKPKNW